MFCVGLDLIDRACDRSGQRCNRCIQIVFDEGLHHVEALLDAVELLSAEKTARSLSASLGLQPQMTWRSLVQAAPRSAVRIVCVGDWGLLVR